MFFAMGGVDAIVFTAGLGENSPFMRDKICNGLEYLGTRIIRTLTRCEVKSVKSASVVLALRFFLSYRQTKN